MMLFISTISTILLLLPALGQAQRRCTTPIGQSGTCLPIRQCQYFTDLEDRYGGSFPRSVRNELLLMQCSGEQRRDFYLCCPRQSGTQAQSLSPAVTERKPVRSVSTDPSNWQQISQRGMRVLESVTNCGLKSNQKVSGGENAQLAEFPWLALLKYQVEGRPFLCGGSLISDRYVITAAHCVVQSAELIGVRLGEHDLNSNPDCKVLGGRFRECSPVYEDFGIEKIQPHPGYVHGSIKYDIALIKLDRSASSYSHIQPICLPIEPKSQAIAHNQDFYIAGWGQTETRQVASVLQKAVVSRQSLDVCRNYFSNAPVSNNHICAAGDGLPHTCQGDSGGPLFFRHKFRNTYRYIQYGVVSFGGKFCGNSEAKPGIYANIIDMLPWITQNLD
ncbi:phenoloxidase-activating factor 3 [Drosophila tropicalis]|uniref:phenoloxidase-activating factor 3 n=1 Tax=Drosophila tropicalis TaxID=46794 RepID=UPI0035AC1C7E